MADTSEKIAERAYLIYEREGRPEGRAFEHWLQAEREVQGGNGADGNRAKSVAKKATPSQRKARRV